MARLIGLSLLLGVICAYKAATLLSGDHPNRGYSSQILTDCSANHPEVTASCTMNQKGDLELTFKASRDCPGSQALTIGKDDGNQMCKTCCREQSCASSSCKSPECENRLKHILQTQIPSVNINFNGSTCPLSVTNSISSDTSSLLWFYKEPKSWIKALQDCYETGSSLVEITNQTVQKKTVSLLQNRTGLENGVWVGLERSIFGTDPEWMWTSGSRSVNPQWSSSFPVDRWNHHCGKIIWGQGSEPIHLLDTNCHEELPYICQDPE